MLLFAGLNFILRIVVAILLYTAGLIGDTSDYSAASMFFGELIPFLALAGAAALMCLFESRNILSYNLAGTRRARHFFAGAAAGFVALSALVGAMAAGGWLHCAPATLSAPLAVRFAALWGCVFLVVALAEEGLFRCYSLSTLARGMNFWWALAAEAGVCLYLAARGGGNGNWGVYAIAALGLVPCFVLHKKAAARSAFWQASWVTSTFFGYYHTTNGGENGIGIFAAAAIGFVFCVSVRLTGSAWWAIGCHAAWDWAETFFYGTANSGLLGQGHLLSATPAGNPLWSGGDDGPEGSLLAAGVILLLLLFLLFAYGRKNSLASQPAN
jgi:hypothetical protein